MNKFLESLYNHEYNFVAMERALISNPDWAKLVRNEEYEKIKIFIKGFRGININDCQSKRVYA